MKSVDALRELVKRDGLILEGEEFDKCLDAIEEEGRTRYGAGHNDGAALAFELAKIAYKDDDELHHFARRVEIAANDRDDVTLFGVDYTPLPVDADGVPIHVGDWITGDWDAKAKVVAITSEDVYWWEPDGCHWCHAHEVRHHHAPTVEDVLWEFAHVGIRIAAKHGIKAGEIDFYADEDAIAEYAAKLRLAGEDA